MTLYGVIPAVLTPFDAAGEVQFDTLRAYVEWLVSKGVHGLFPCGTNGEGPAMTTQQRSRVISLVVEAAAGRVPVVPMTGAISTAVTIDLTRHARQSGAAGAAIVAPWYFPHDDLALEAHFGAVAEAVPDFDLYLYNIPGNAKNAISPALAARLAERYPQIRGVKDSSKSLDNLKAYVGALPGRKVIVGTDSMVLEAMDAGASGVVSAIADCFPEMMVALYDAVRSGERDRAVDLQAKVCRLRDALKRGPYVHPYKLAVQWRGLTFGGMRRPLRECTAAEAAGIRAALEEMGVLG
ncbi:MAG TPA: dihydrodipicolinate synthase family protein [Symbiobacteriaceae bacterium]|nr:dihydrodipicolinate synthase family protein [Symbiobacteriaceae bacterium]